jgi:hypothetical protein
MEDFTMLLELLKIHLGKHTKLPILRIRLAVLRFALAAIVPNKMTFWLAGKTLPKRDHFSA